MNTGLVSREATKRKARSSSFKSCKMSRRNEIGVTFNLEKVAKQPAKDQII